MGRARRCPPEKCDIAAAGDGPRRRLAAYIISVLDRHLGPRALIGVVIFAVALAWGLSQVLGKDADDPPAGGSASVTATPCTEVSDPFGPPPDTLAYEKVDEKTRAKTAKALKLDEAGGKVEMRAARRSGQTLGTLVRVPSEDPAAYARDLVRTAERGGAPVTKSKRYSVLPLQGGSVVAVGVRGCSTILIGAPDPSAVPFVANAVFAPA
jgi:hypothetical protein